MISNAERIVLRNMYPPGCRVELEEMEADPYVKLSPGDLGTVQFVDDAGQIHVSAGAEVRRKAHPEIGRAHV